MGSKALLPPLLSKVFSRKVINLMITALTAWKRSAESAEALSQDSFLDPRPLYQFGLAYLTERKRRRHFKAVDMTTNFHFYTHTHPTALDFFLSARDERTGFAGLQKRSG